MTTAKESSGWIPQLLAVLGTCATTWVLIRTETRTIVEAQLQAQLEPVKVEVMSHMDSLFAASARAMRQRIEQRADSATSEVLASMGLLYAKEPGQQPRIVVHADTVGRSRLTRELDTIAAQNERILHYMYWLNGQVQESLKRPDPPIRDKRRPQPQK